MNSTLKGLRPTVGLRRPKNTLRIGEGQRLARKRLGRPISIGAKPPASGRLYASNEFDLEGPSANGRPTPTEKSALRVGEGRRLARKRLGRPISIGAKAFGQRSACADRKILFASAKADARRVAP
jgi:hypothetical protein